MKYNTRNVYFGTRVYNTDEGYYFTSPEAFIKQENDTYCTLDGKLKLTDFKGNENKELTVSMLHPITEFINKEIPKQVSKTEIRLYLLKHMMVNRKEHFVDPYMTEATNKINEDISKAK